MFLPNDPEPSLSGAAPHNAETTAERPFFFLHIRKAGGVPLRGRTGRAIAICDRPPLQPARP
jgi:hypothetical protein